MRPTLLTTLVDEKAIMRYLNTIAPDEYAQATDLLVDCLGFAILTAVLPFYEPEAHSEIAAVLAFGEENQLRKWFSSQPEEVQLSIRETVDRIFLSLQ